MECWVHCTTVRRQLSTVGSSTYHGEKYIPWGAVHNMGSSTYHGEQYIPLGEVHIIRPHQSYLQHTPGEEAPGSKSRIVHKAILLNRFRAPFRKSGPHNFGIIPLPPRLWVPKPSKSCSVPAPTAARLWPMSRSLGQYSLPIQRRQQISSGKLMWEKLISRDDDQMDQET